MSDLTVSEKTHIRASFERIAPNAEQIIHVFYDRLFEIDPTTRTLFTHTDMVNQGAKLFNTLLAAVSLLDDLDKLRDEMDALGKRHRGYGVAEEQYSSVGEALLFAFATSITPPLAQPEEQAWRKLYVLMSQFAMTTTR